MRGVVLALLFIPSALAAQVRATPADSAAQDAWSKSNWPLAVTTYQVLARRDSAFAQYRFRLGVALVRTGQYVAARPHLAAAERLGSPAAQVAFWIGISYARTSPDTAFAQWRRATSAGLATVPSGLDADSAFLGLRRDSRFKEFETAIDVSARPCMHDARFSQFDFWLGEWEVRPTGQPLSSPARNVITKEHDGCVVHESWMAPGSTGQSFNIYDRTRDKWFQTWVDNGGGMHEYAGGLQNGAMVMLGESTIPTSPTRVKTRLSFTPSPEGVRQLSEVTSDSGKTWRVNYDLFYTRPGRSGAACNALVPGDKRVDGSFLTPYRRIARQIVTDGDGKVLNARLQWRDELVPETGQTSRLRHIVTMLRFDGAPYAADTTVFETLTMAPVWNTEWVAGTLAWRREFGDGGRRVNGQRYVADEGTGLGRAPDSTRRLDIHLAHAAYDFYGTMDALLAASIPHTAGETTCISTYAPVGDSLVTLPLRVLRKEPVEAGAGKIVQATVVETNGLSGPLRLWVSKVAPFVLRTEETVLHDGKPWRIYTTVMVEPER